MNQIKKRKIREWLTPFNIVSILLLGFSIYSLIELEAFGIAFFIIYFPLGVISFIIDHFLYGKYDSSKTIIIEISLVILISGMIYFVSSWRERTETLLISDDFKREYVTIIYGVDKKQELPLSWNYIVKIPMSGVFLTSSDANERLPITKIKTDSFKDIKWNYWHFVTDTLCFKQNVYTFRSWIIDSKFYIYKEGDIDSLKIYLKEILYKQLPPTSGIANPRAEV